MPNAGATPITLERLHKALAGAAAALRCVTDLQPAGNEGDKVFPPTYEGGKYAFEKRRLPGQDEPIDCVLLNSVQSEANHMELALLDAWERGRIPLPVVTVDFSQADLPKTLRVSSLEAPHRIADALLRDSLLDGKPFRKSEIGARLDNVENRNATALFELCPTTLVFGMWDSTGPKGGLGAKFARAMVSEIIGLEAQVGKRTSSRIDPLQIEKNAGPLYRTVDGGWTLNPSEALDELDKARKPTGRKVLYKRANGKDVYHHPEKDAGKIPDPGRPSTANHGNVTPTIADGGVTISKARQTTVLSLPALRRLRFPLGGQTRSEPAIDDAARVALAALALCAAELSRERGYDLRSRCQLHPMSAPVWELLDEPGAEPQQFSCNGKVAVELYAQAVKNAKKAGLPWLERELVLQPSKELAGLVRKSQELAAKVAADDSEEA